MHSFVRNYHLFCWPFYVLLFCAACEVCTMQKKFFRCAVICFKCNVMLDGQRLHTCFFTAAGFPKCVGAIDCTQIQHIPPSDGEFISRHLKNVCTFFKCASMCNASVWACSFFCCQTFIQGCKRLCAYIYIRRQRFYRVDQNELIWHFIQNSFSTLMS